MRQLSSIHFTFLTILREKFHQRRLADNVGAFACIVINDGDAVAMLLHESSAEIEKAARFRNGNKRIAGG